MLCSVIIPPDLKMEVNEGVWAQDLPGWVKHHPPVKVTLKPGATPVIIRQYRIPAPLNEGLILIIEILKKGWPWCLKAVAAAVVMICDTLKL